MQIKKITMQDLADLAENAADVLRQVRDKMIDPHPRKTAPTFTSTAIARLCNVEKSQIKYLTQKHNLPFGTKLEGSKSKEYTLEEAITWVKAIGNKPTRPANMRGKVVAVCNYKGGVAKTSTLVSLAQASTLRGLKVLIVDCDGQGTATQLMGISPEQDVELEQSIMPFIAEDEPDLMYAVQESYWHNLSIIPAFSGLLAAEYHLPAKALNSRGYPFWAVLKQGLEPLRDHFDLILIDTSPSLSHLTMNAMFASDGLIMACPPEALAWTSSVQFWGLFSELIGIFPKASEKELDFMTIVFTKVKNDGVTPLIKKWMSLAYGSYLNSNEIPESEIAKTTAAQLKTVYDLSKPDGHLDAYRRYKDPLDRLADYLLDQLSLAWSQE